LGGSVTAVPVFDEVEVDGVAVVTTGFAMVEETMLAGAAVEDEVMVFAATDEVVDAVIACDD
jgi:hypothetical protein